MMVQALVNLRLRSPGGVIDLPLGATIDLPQDKVDALLMKIPDKIRVIRPGFLVTWNSLLFGVCEGRVTEVEAEAVVIGEHGVTKNRATIPAAWIINIEEDLSPRSRV